MLMAILENYYVPEYAYNSEPITHEHKLQNCKLLFDLLDEAGLPRPNCNPEGNFVL
jgi:hypothetical protein